VICKYKATRNQLCCDAQVQSNMKSVLSWFIGSKQSEITSTVIYTFKAALNQICRDLYVQSKPKSVLLWYIRRFRVTWNQFCRDLYVQCSLPGINSILTYKLHHALSTDISLPFVSRGTLTKLGTTECPINQKWIAKNWGGGGGVVAAESEVRLTTRHCLQGVKADMISLSQNIRSSD
jgi:hypothetical protein